MGITDKLTGRVKQAAGDLAGDESLRRQGVEEERKGEAKAELARAEESTERKRQEVDALERRTDPGRLEEDRSKDELYDEARDLGVEGRSDMTKEQLADEITRRS